MARMDGRRMTAWWKPQDFVWLGLFAALAWVSPRRSPAELEMLAGLALVQLLTPRIRWFNTPQGAVAASSLKLLLGFLLIGVTGGINSPYAPVLLLPVVSAATTLGGGGVAAITLLACVAHLAFIPFASRFGHQFSAEEIRKTILWVIFLPVVGFLTWQLAEANRSEARRAQAAADELQKALADLQEAEAAVRRSERLAALGQLTAGLAHELRNPMGTMKASAEMLLKHTREMSPVVRELAGYVSSEVDRTNSLITRFLDFARPLQLRPAAADLNDLIDTALERLETELAGRGVAVHKNLDPSIPKLNLDAQLMERVLANLIVNAVQASPAGSTVSIKTRALPDGAEISVIDRGGGIPPELREQIFNPFFTTKPDGVGLGLAIVSKIVDEHRGTIQVDSEPGRGSIFSIFLPT